MVLLMPSQCIKDVRQLKVKIKQKRPAGLAKRVTANPGYLHKIQLYRDEVGSSPLDASLHIWSAECSPCDMFEGDH